MELEQRNRGSRRSWWEPDKSEQREEHEAEKLQQLTEELEALEMRWSFSCPTQ